MAGSLLSDPDTFYEFCAVHHVLPKARDESTVKAHLKAILRKLHLRNRTQAALWAINNGVAASSR
jgi:Bacterial regulatory proteins, luxR family